MIKSFDSYGYKIQLTYKNENKYKTFLGGLVTLIAYLGVFIFFVVLMKQVIYRENFTVNSFAVKSDVLETGRNVELSIDNFDMAIQVVCLGCTDIIAKPEDVHQYFSVYILNSESKLIENGAFVNTDIPIHMEKCDASRFKGKLGSYYADSYLCMRANQKIDLFGSFSSTISKYIMVNLDYCNQSILDS